MFFFSKPLPMEYQVPSYVSQVQLLWNIDPLLMVYRSLPHPWYFDPIPMEHQAISCLKLLVKYNCCGILTPPMIYWLHSWNIKLPLVLTCESSNTVIPWYVEAPTHGIQIRRVVIKKTWKKSFALKLYLLDFLQVFIYIMKLKVNQRSDWCCW